MADQKIVLAYSGGLDTSCILKYLQEKGYQVVAFIADLGQEDDMAALERRAHDQGAVAVHVVDLRRDFVTEFVLPAIAGNALYEGRYLLGTSLARPLIARGQVEVARAEGAGWVSHGATGKGNDQVRFELAYAALAPQLERYRALEGRRVPRALQGPQRPAALRRAAWHRVSASPSSKPWSTDENLMHKSYESGILEDPAWRRPTRCSPSHPLAAGRARPAGDLELDFKDGAPGRARPPADGRRVTDPLELFVELNRLGGEHGDRPRRHGREPVRRHQVARRLRDPRRHHPAPGAARSRGHGDGPRGAARRATCCRRSFAQLIYNGFWFSPEMDFIRAAFARPSAVIDGRCRWRSTRAT